MRIGNLCVTRKNMGDSSMLPMPSTVSVAKINSDYCNSSKSKSYSLFVILIIESFIGKNAFNAS